MQLVYLTGIEEREIAINVEDIIAIRATDHTYEWENEHGFEGCPTEVLVEHLGQYVVQEDFKTVCLKVEAAAEYGKANG